jgi:hypothetical protein
MTKPDLARNGKAGAAPPKRPHEQEKQEFKGKSSWGPRVGDEKKGFKGKPPHNKPRDPTKSSTAPPGGDAGKTGKSEKLSVKFKEPMKESKKDSKPADDELTLEDVLAFGGSQVSRFALCPRRAPLHSRQPYLVLTSYLPGRL